MKKTAKNSVKNNKKVAQANVVNNPTADAQKVIVAQKKFGRWYVYFQGIRPADNVGCACKTAKSAIRYMMLLKARYGAAISNNIFDRLRFEATMEAAL